MAILIWTAAAVLAALSLWSIAATIVEVWRGKSRPLCLDVVVGVLFHGVTAVFALWLATQAVKNG